MNSDRPSVSPLAVLFVGILGISSGTILARLAQEQAVPSLVVAAWRLAVSALFLFPLALTRRRQELSGLTNGQWRLAILSGFMLAIHFVTLFAALSRTSIASATVLVSTAPLWVGLAAPFLLGERLTRPLQVGIVLALAGTAFIGLADGVPVTNSRFQQCVAPLTAETHPLLGNGLALASALAAAAYLLIGRRLRPKMSLLSYTAVVYTTAALFLLLAVAFSPVRFFGYPGTAVIFLLLAALLPQLVGHTAYNWALGYLPAAYVSISLVAEPIGATLLALLIFAEVPTLFTLIGGALLLGGILYAGHTT